MCACAYVHVQGLVYVCTGARVHVSAHACMCVCQPDNFNTPVARSIAYKSSCHVTLVPTLLFLFLVTFCSTVRSIPTLTFNIFLVCFL